MYFLIDDPISGIRQKKKKLAHLICSSKKQKISEWEICGSYKNIFSPMAVSVKRFELPLSEKVFFVVKGFIN